MDGIKDAAQIIKDSKYLIVYTGAGISVESGIPQYRGRDGLWSKIEPLQLNYFFSNPKDAWQTIRERFYNHILKAEPNQAHTILAEMENHGILKSIVTQNIDNLHKRAGSRNVLEYHGSTRSLSCIDCSKKYLISDISLESLPPRCGCSGVLKPDFVFFGEQIPSQVAYNSSQEALKADVVLVIGTTGVVFPAASIPIEAKNNGAKIIEINPEESEFTSSITDVFLQGKASIVLKELWGMLK